MTPAKKMLALSILQPWAWFIALGHKPYENRTWNTKYRGNFYIHAGKGFDKEGYEWVKEKFPEIELPKINEFQRGGIVGQAKIYQVADASSSPWFAGPLAFCIAGAEPVKFVPMRGMLGFFDPRLGGSR